jgi:hypothetical protein
MHKCVFSKKIKIEAHTNEYRNSHKYFPNVMSKLVQDIKILNPIVQPVDANKYLRFDLKLKLI